MNITELPDSNIERIFLNTNITNVGILRDEDGTTIRLEFTHKGHPFLYTNIHFNKEMMDLAVKTDKKFLEKDLKEILH